MLCDERIVYLSSHFLDVNTNNALGTLLHGIVEFPLSVVFCISY